MRNKLKEMEEAFCKDNVDYLSGYGVPHSVVAMLSKDAAKLAIEYARSVVPTAEIITENGEINGNSSMYNSCREDMLKSISQDELSLGEEDTLNNK